MVTANEGKRHEAYAKTLGVDAYMHKPLRLEKLIETAEELLNERDRRRGDRLDGAIGLQYSDVDFGAAGVTLLTRGA
ncbi:MAG: hypothetical protein HC774_02975 [Sphingomonadales bacterium]|nr:hypothetical protein [Sphingomonadales bacterium]